MIVSELTEILQKHPADMRVVLNGNEDSYDDSKAELTITPAIHLRSGVKSWEGTCGEVNDTASYDENAAIVDALFFNAYPTDQ